MAEPYQPQLSPGNSPTLSGASAEDFGAAVGRSLVSAGDQIDATIHQLKERHRDEQALSAGVDLAKFSANMDQQAIDARANAAPGGAGHTQAITQSFDQGSAQALGQIRDPHIRAQFAERYAELRNNVVTREYGWEAGQRVDKQVSDYSNMTRTLADGQAANADAGGLQVSINTIATTANALSVPADTKTKLIREGQRDVVLAFANNLADSNPKALNGDEATGTKGLLDQGILSPYLQPEDIKSLRSAADVEIRHQEALARYKADQAKTAQVSANGTFEYRVNNMGYVPTTKEWEDYVAANQNLGLTKDALEISTLKDKAEINQQYRSAPPATWHTDINALQEKVAAGSASEFDKMHLANLVALAGPAIDKFNSDPHGFAAATPNPPPAVDWSSADPQALQLMGAQRAQWARSFAPSNGIVNPASVLLNNDEKKQFGDGLKGPPADQLAALTKLQAAFGPAITGQVAAYLAPGDKNLELMASLNPRGMALYVHGATALSTKDVHLGAASGPDAEADKQGINDALDFYTGSRDGRGSAVPIDLVPAFRNMAYTIAAGVVAENHGHELTGDELKSVIGQAAQRVAGMRGRPQDGDVTGGFANWRGNPVWLPSDMSRQDFARRLTSAEPTDWVKAGGGEPYYVGSDGKPAQLSPQQMAQLPYYHLVPVKAATGDYALADQNGARLKQKDGRTDWQFNIRNLR